MQKNIVVQDSLVYNNRKHFMFAESDFNYCPVLANYCEKKSVQVKLYIYNNCVNLIIVLTLIIPTEGNTIFMHHVVTDVTHHFVL